MIYHHDRMIPSVDPEMRAGSTPLCFHLIAFGFSKECTTKPAPFHETAIELMEEIVKDGFVTASDPLIVHQPVELLQPRYDDDLRLLSEEIRWTPSAPTEPVLNTMSLGYVKGMARVCTVLSLIHHSWKRGYDLEARHPKLFTSLLRVWAIHTACSSKRELALTNMKLSTRGSIRKPPNVVTILYMCMNLAEAGHC